MDFYDHELDDESSEGDICRVCRMEATFDKPLHYPCVCTGSIKFIHQDCLVQWLQHSKKEYCELCNHKFTFKPVYAPDMPKSLPLCELCRGLTKNILRALRFWLHYTLVVVAWLGVVPLTAYRIYKCLFAGSVNSLMTLPTDMLSLENIFTDCLLGVVVVALSVGGFIMILWLREQIYIHGGPEWLNEQEDNVQPFQIEVFIANLLGNIREPPAPPLQEENAEQANLDNDENNEVENNDADNGDANGGDDAIALVDEVEDDEDAEQAAIDDGAVNAEAPVIDDGGWNADGIMEDLTWEKFLGLDGSFVFLEHVFWIISLNTSFVLVFAFCPYNIGKIPLLIAGSVNMFTDTSFDGIIIISIGYVLIAVVLVLVHSILKFTSFKRVRKTFGLAYVILKVSLLMAIEIGLFPLICGWWLDTCSLPLFALTVKDRKESFLYAPVTATFLHWLVGMLYVFYFAAFIILLREIVRPGVLWFLRNVNDPQFHPVKEMIKLSVVRHSRRFILSLVVFGTTVLVLVWIPIQLLKRLTTGLIPFNVSLSSNAPISEMSLELLLLQVVLPAFVEQGHARRWLKTFINHWTNIFAYLLDLRSYMVGDIDLKSIEEQATILHVDNNGKWQRGPPPRGTPIENPLEGVGSPTVRAYSRTKHFHLKMVILITWLIVSFVAVSCATLVFPVMVGRKCLSFVFGDVVIHELYTAASGFYIIWLLLRILTIVHSWYPAGFRSLYKKTKTVVTLISKLLIVTAAFLGVIPFFLGVFFELVVVIPLRVALNETPLIYIWQDWALGILHLKIICALVMVGPEWWLKEAIDRAYRNGIVNMNLSFIIKQIFYPVITTLLLALTIPYVMTAGMLPYLSGDRDLVILSIRRVYPVVMFCIVLVGAIIFQGKQFKALYEKIKNEKYLIGKVLVNYEGRGATVEQTTTEQPSSQP